MNKQLLTHIHELASRASILDPDANEHEYWHAKLKDYSSDFLNALPNSPTIRNIQNANVKHAFNVNQTASIDAIFDIINEHITNHCIDTASAGYLAFIPGGGIPLSAFADYIAALSNRYAGNIIASPGAVEMEREMLRWIYKLVGFPDTASGNLTSGGSYANMIALVTAREAFNLKPADIEKSVIYLSDLTHHSVIKCLRTIGLHYATIRHIAVDEQYRINADVLEKTINDDKSQGLNPFLIVATAGTTDTGSIDPLDRIAAIAKQHKLWLHIDAAYGGFFKLASPAKSKLAGMALADSITLDPHKGLFLPYGIGAVVIKDSTLQKQAFSSTANYMQDIVCDPDDWSPCDMSPELSKHFRALRMWMPLKYYGVEPFRDALEEKLLLAQYFYQELSALPNFQIACQPDLSIVAFRYIPENADINEFNKQLLQHINSDNRLFLSSTLLNGQYYIRMACLSFRTHLQDIQLALNIIFSYATRLQETKLC